MKPRTTVLALALAASSVLAQTPIPQPVFAYANGVLASNNYMLGALSIPGAHQYDHNRVDIDMFTDTGSIGIVRSVFLDNYGPGFTYGATTLGFNHGTGLTVGDYMRVQNAPGGTGPTIARKTAVRGDPNQWGVWAEQINMGPGAKAALWISSDNAEIEGRGVDVVPNVIVINNDLNVQNSVVQWNASMASTGVFLRVFRGSQLVFEVTADGALRAKRVEIIP